MAKASDADLKKLETQKKQDKQANEQKENNENNNNNTDNNNNNNTQKKPINAANVQNLKQLRIQSGALKRLGKELILYMKELKDLKNDLQDLLDDEQKANNNKGDIKRQRESVAETENVIRGVRPRLIETYEKVKELMEDCEGFLEEEDKELFDNTKKYMEIAEPLVND